MTHGHTVRGQDENVSLSFDQTRKNSSFEDVRPRRPIDSFTFNRQKETGKYRPRCWTRPGAGGENIERRGWAVCVVLPRQLTHHLQQGLVLLFQLLVLIFNVIQVLRTEQNSSVVDKFSLDTLRPVQHQRAGQAEV